MNERIKHRGRENGENEESKYLVKIRMIKILKGKFSGSKKFIFFWIKV